MSSCIRRAPSEFETGYSGDRVVFSVGASILPRGRRDRDSITLVTAWDRSKLMSSWGSINHPREVLLTVERRCRRLKHLLLATNYGIDCSPAYIFHELVLEKHPYRLISNRNEHFRMHDATPHVKLNIDVRRGRVDEISLIFSKL